MIDDKISIASAISYTPTKSNLSLAPNQIGAEDQCSDTSSQKMETLNTQPNLAQIQNANKKPPHQLNLYKGSHAEQPTNSEENKQSQQQQQSASQYQYKPPLQKKKNQKQNSHQQKESVDQISGLIIESKEYQSKNQNEEDQNYQSPSSAGISGSKQTQFLKKKQVSTKPFQSRKAQQPQVQGQPSASLTPEGQQSQHQQTFQQASGSYQADEKDAQQVPPLSLSLSLRSFVRMPLLAELLFGLRDHSGFHSVAQRRAFSSIAEKKIKNLTELTVRVQIPKTKRRSSPAINPSKK